MKQPTAAHPPAQMRRSVRRHRIAGKGKSEMSPIKMVALNPIETNQILDAINGTKPNTTSKKKMIDDNHVLSVNGKTAYRVYTDDENIYYYLRRNSGTKYYYPIAFAKIEITVLNSRKS